MQQIRLNYLSDTSTTTNVQYTTYKIDNSYTKKSYNFKTAPTFNFCNITMNTNLQKNHYQVSQDISKS